MLRADPLTVQTTAGVLVIEDHGVGSGDTRPPMWASSTWRTWARSTPGGLVTSQCIDDQVYHRLYVTSYTTVHLFVMGKPV